MTGPGPAWRPPTSVPPWAAAILTVAGIMLMINALPMLAAAITPDRESSAPGISVPPSPVPLPDGRVTPPSPLPLGRSLDQSAGPSSGQSARTQTGTHRARDDRPAEPGTDVRGLPWSGGNPVPPLVVALVLLSAGLGLLRVVGCSGDRPWPGRYVRRIG